MRPRLMPPTHPCRFPWSRYQGFTFHEYLNGPKVKKGSYPYSRAKITMDFASADLALRMRIP
jgi:hypothetical protein